MHIVNVCMYLCMWLYIFMHVRELCVIFNIKSTTSTTTSTLHPLTYTLTEPATPPCMFIVYLYFLYMCAYICIYIYIYINIYMLRDWVWIAICWLGKFHLSWVYWSIYRYILRSTNSNFCFQKNIPPHKCGCISLNRDCIYKVICSWGKFLLNWVYWSKCRYIHICV